MSVMKVLKVSAAALVAFFWLATYAYADGSVSIEIGDVRIGASSDNEKGSTAHPQKQKGGPPDHAPAHGYRTKHKYRYYPSAQVYFDTDRGLYFYLSKDDWRVTASLPSSLKMSLGSHISLEMDSDRPYVHHAEHKRKYPPGHVKKTIHQPKPGKKHRGNGKKHR
jgi:hypothetical protein